ncbi:GntR family transcriptional regulator [Pantoea agglomerans]|uniref:GntR family transcriptional regulator n=1 Tax=Enterobacter agglomerans TaxID=549 RepID=UPI0023AEF575|nr:FCD domain-containing protein [Pantoea agglomerans]WEC75280.1 FCD domain-containing protein [Pantoea agglomerans]WNK38074.1 FCD domain-containing protein [Pantoea agglomerans]WNK74212.1 FCD domain-containing protein [Pantoea agglomerans]
MNESLASRDSLTQTTYSRLRDALLSCQLVPGARLNTKELAEALDTNVGAIREALSRLTSENLVIAEPQKGFRVTPVSLADLLDLTATRKLIECECLSESLAHGDVNWEGEILSAFHLLARYGNGDDEWPGTPEWNRRHNRFHDALTSACPNTWLLRMQRMLFIQNERYRILSVNMTRGERDLNAEHKALMEAALSRDTEQIKRLMQEHIQKTTDVVIKLFDEHGMLMLHG